MASTPRTTRPAFGAVALGLVLISGCAMAVVAGRDRAADIKPYAMNNAGELVRPTGYRTWVYVGTPVTPNDMNNGKAAFPEHHNVYIDPESYKHYLATGEWREGTILVKELVSVGGKAAASGNGYFQGDFIGLEATIKSKADFPDEPGNWAYFSFTNHEMPSGDLKPAAAAFPAASCNACHAGNAQDDFVFTQHYPVLRAAKGAGSAPENETDRPKTLGMGMPGMMGEPEANAEATFDQSRRDRLWRATAATPTDVAGNDMTLTQNALFNYLRNFEYRDWSTKETRRHPSRGPHTNFGKPVRAYFNDTLASSMRAGNTQHPVGATAVKEMYDDSNKLAGWAVEVKTAADSGQGDGWFWYEVTSTTDGSNPVAIGNGVTGCVGCHQGSPNDHVLSTWPLQ